MVDLTVLRDSFAVAGRLCDFQLEQMLIQCGLEREAHQAQPAAEEAEEAPRPKRLKLGQPEDALWEGLY